MLLLSDHSVRTLRVLACLREHLFSGRLVDAGVVRLFVDGLDLSILSHDSVTLRSVLTEDSGGVEEEVKLLGELAGGVAQEANSARGGSVEALAPCLHYFCGIR